MLTEIPAHTSDRHTIFNTSIIDMWFLLFQAGSGRLGILRQRNSHEVNEPNMHNCLST